MQEYLFLSQHGGSLPEVDDQKGQQNYHADVGPQIDVDFVQDVVLLIHRRHIGLEVVVIVSSLQLQDGSINQNVGPKHAFIQHSIVFIEVNPCVFSQGGLGRGAVSTAILTHVESQLVLIVARCGVLDGYAETDLSGVLVGSVPDVGFHFCF